MDSQWSNVEMNREVREETEVFERLEKLCSSSGYVHAIAYFCFRDNTIRYSDEMFVQDVLEQFSADRLVRTEISTLIGLLCKSEIDIALPTPDKLQRYIEQTDSLLKEIHQSMMLPMKTFFDPAKTTEKEFNPFENGSLLRESIFYGGESAYNFQYRDLSFTKYQKDNDWFVCNKGYSLNQASAVVAAIGKFQNDKITNVMMGLTEKPPSDWTLFPAFTFTVDDIANYAGLDYVNTKSVIESFVAPAEINKNDFSALDDFNPINAYPILTLNKSEYLLFQNYSLVEALYETPFFWFNNDSSYKNLAMKHRGEFTENFSAERLKIVFGEDRVFTNIDIVDSKKTKAGEIDVLVVYANRAIILQAKSKRLTIAARKGNDNCLRNDFKQAIQEAYNQGYSCANLLGDSNYKLLNAEANELKINREYKEIYLFCVVSDHYPALSFQARQFLQYQQNEKIMPPFVMDVFLLDVMTEMLPSPLYFLSYINRRTQYNEKLLSTHELTILSYHLKQNLWLDDEYTMMQLGDDICADLDLAMLTRRGGAPGIKTPDGILTRYRDTFFGRTIRDIERQENPGTIDLGFLLLSLSGDTIDQINGGIEKIASLARKDDKHHDFTLGFKKGETGLTIHCNRDHMSVAGPRLDRHCNRRKYSEKAQRWFGICIEPEHMRLKFGLCLEYEWEQSDEMDEVVKGLPRSQYLKSKKAINFDTKIRPYKKIGRNEKCPCGSGKKYKKCCLT